MARARSRRRAADETQGFDAVAAAHDDGPDPAVARSRRRFARRQWARRWLAWRRVVVLLGALAVLGVAVWLVWFSSFLSVQGVQVTGTELLRPAQVERAAAVPVGDPLATVDLDRIRARVEALAAVRSADVTREWPDHVRISVTERRPVAVVDLGDSLHGLDENGVVFRDYATAPAGLPRIESRAGTGSEALREGARVAAALPDDLAAKVDHVTVESVDEITLVLHSGKDVSWGSATDSEEKAAVLARLLPAAPKAEHLDVSVPGHPVTS